MTVRPPGTIPRRPGETALGRSFWATLLLFGCLLPGIAKATTHTVCSGGCDFPTVQGAVNGASDGDTIQIVSTVHTEADVVVFRSVALEGLPGLSTTIQAAATEDTFDGRILSVPSGVTVTIRDLILRHGSLEGPGGGILNQGTLILERTEVRANSTGDCCSSEDQSGGGIYNQGSLFLHDSVIEDNRSATEGGGIYSASGASLVAIDSELQDNRALQGGNLFNEGVATLVRCYLHLGRTTGSGAAIYNRGDLAFQGLIVSNIADGAAGGVYQEEGTLEISDSWITSNRADNIAGGIGIAGGSVEVRRTTVAFNAALDGGGVHQSSASPVDLVNVTLFANVAIRHGGGLYVADGRLARLASSTIALNKADRDETSTGPGDGNGDGGGIYLAPCPGFCTSRAVLKNAIVADNEDLSPDGPNAHDCLGELWSESHLLVEDGSTGSVGPCRIVGDLEGVFVGIAPGFGTYGDHGGPPAIEGQASTPTLELLASSPAVDGGNPAGCTDSQGSLLPTDQRGFGRAGLCDLGAFEFDGLPQEPVFGDGFESGDTSLWGV